MVYDNFVEPHCPDRVMRQFGLLQPFPVSLGCTFDRVTRHDHKYARQPSRSLFVLMVSRTTSDAISYVNRMSRAGLPFDDTWVEKLEPWVEEWDRADWVDFRAVPRGRTTDAAYKEYLRWYQPRTRCRITYVPSQPQPHQATVEDTYAHHRDQALAAAVSSFNQYEIQA
jgi:hypothetical protein